MLLKQFSGADYSPPVSYKVVAVTTVPDDDLGLGLGEPTEDPDYEPLVIENNSTEFGVNPETGNIVNLKEWAFAPSTTDWGPVFGIALYDDVDNYMGYLPFSTVKFLTRTNILKLAPGAFIISSDDTPLSVYIEEAHVPITFTSPNGDRYLASVNNSGVLILTLTEFMGPPSAPLSLTNTSGYLEWIPATNDGGTPVVSQTIWLAGGDDSLVSFEVLDPDISSYDTQGVAGWYYVTAENITGSSSPSNTVYAP
jgi:hypothetical protein